ncbi:hypothetical protein P3T23_005756 [Paraburkholderia sp. GAS448]
MDTAVKSGESTQPGTQKGTPHRVPHRRSRIARGSVLVALCAGLAGCGLAAAPCRIASAGLKIVPVVGHVAAAPTDACAEVIDP